MRILKNVPNKTYAVAAVVLGILNHFLYRLSGGQAFAALFCPVNESVWEHLKLLFFPILFVSVAEYLRYRPDPVRFFYYRFLSAVCAMGMTITLFYTSGISKIVPKGIHLRMVLSLQFAGTC